MIKPRRLIILGAGFSVPAGLPLACELSKEVLRRADNNDLFIHLNKDINRYLDYVKRRYGTQLRRDGIEIEKLMSYLDIRHYLSINDTWSEQGDKGQLCVRSLIAQILLERQMQMSDQQWAPYLRFAELLCPGDTVVTFNYDTILENACLKTGKQFRHCPLRHNAVHEGGGGEVKSESELNEVVIHKVHGSVDWYSKKQYLIEEEDFNSDPHKGTRPTSNAKVFGDPELLGIERLVCDPFPKDSILYHMYRVTKMLPLMGERGVTPPPYLVTPSVAKIVYLKPLAEFWRGFDFAGAYNSQMIIIGFSFSDFDEYAMVPIVDAISNFEEEITKRSNCDKTKLKIIDHQSTEDKIKQFKDRVTCISWDRAAVFWEGFNESIIPKILE